MKSYTYDEVLSKFTTSFYAWKFNKQRLNYTLYSNEDIIPRGFGKTTILNEIGLLAQVYNYEVLILTPYNNTHFATERIDRYEQLRSHRVENGILLIDEIDISDKKNLQMLRDLIDSGILILGFVRGEVKND